MDLTLDQYRTNLAGCFDLARSSSPLVGTCANYDPAFVESDLSTVVGATPERCDLYVSGLTDAEIALRTKLFLLKDCLEENDWVLSQLGEEACPTNDEYLAI